MKRTHLLWMFLLAAGFIACTGNSAVAQGKLEVIGGPSYDWGNVAPGKLNTVIQVKNSGSGDLKISDVRPSCGCTIAPIDKKLLKPGEIGKITVTLDVTSRTGATEKTITVYSDDPSNASQVIYLKAFVKRPVSFNPAQYFLVNNAKVGVAAPAAVTIVNSGDEPLTIFPPEFVQGNVKTTFDMKEKKTLKPGEQLELKATITPEAAGSINGLVRLKTSHKDYQTVDLNIYGSAAADASPADAGAAAGAHK